MILSCSVLFFSCALDNINSRKSSTDNISWYQQFNQERSFNHEKFIAIFSVFKFFYLQLHSLQAEREAQNFFSCSWKEGKHRAEKCFRKKCFYSGFYVVQWLQSMLVMWATIWKLLHQENTKSGRRAAAKITSRMSIQTTATKVTRLPIQSHEIFN